MESKSFFAASGSLPELKIRVIPGHFSTSRSHVNFYLDMTEIKSGLFPARKAAQALAFPFFGRLTETIICLDGTEVIGALLAENLSGCGMGGINRGLPIHVLTPEITAAGQFLLRRDSIPEIDGKSALILAASVTTGQTIRQAAECTRYYGGNVSGAAAIFSLLNKMDDFPIFSIFGAEDFPGYQTYPGTDCPLCRKGVRIDAIINQSGYAKL